VQARRHGRPPEEECEQQPKRCADG
jgi:hypothetical protein